MNDQVKSTIRKTVLEMLSNSTSSKNINSMMEKHFEKVHYELVPIIYYFNSTKRYGPIHTPSRNIMRGPQLFEAFPSVPTCMKQPSLYN
jgi:hypothetical protein